MNKVEEMKVEMLHETRLKQISAEIEVEAIDIAIKALTDSLQPKEKWTYCSECEWDKKDAELVCNIPTNFCPNCGADMRGGTENE